MTTENRFMQIGEVSERTGVTQRTLRFYEEKGLLNPPARMEGGFRLYSEDDVQRVELIRQLQKLLGFSLAEIKDMVEAEEIKTQLRAESRDNKANEARQRRLRKAIEVTEKQVEIIDNKIEQLSQMRVHWCTKLARYHEVLRQIEESLSSASPLPPN
ncbi:MAG: MerR family transcriptional regulator [Chloroflexi bacterium]|nr:MerR family transcriptional regulator [Chloroflexota bacterium]